MKRIHLNFDDSAVKSLEEVQEFLNGRNITDTIRRALALAKVFADNEKKGFNRICLENDANERKELQLLNG